MSDGWWKYVGARGRIIGMNSFGASAPAGELFEHFGFSHDNLLNNAKDILGL